MSQVPYLVPTQARPETAQAGVSAIRPRPRKPADDDFTVAVEEPRPLIRQGVYEAASTSVRRRRYRHRPYLEVFFNVYEGSIDHGVVIARGVPGFFNLPTDGHRLGKSSKLARFIHLLNPATSSRSASNSWITSRTQQARAG